MEEKERKRQENYWYHWLDGASISMGFEGSNLARRAQEPIDINVDSYKDYGGYVPVYRCQGDR